MQPLREFQYSTVSKLSKFLCFMQKSVETTYHHGEAEVCSTWQQQNA